MLFCVVVVCQVYFLFARLPLTDGILMRTIDYTIIKHVPHWRDHDSGTATQHLGFVSISSRLIVEVNCFSRRL